jgi:hypothetical protein
MVTNIDKTWYSPLFISANAKVNTIINNTKSFLSKSESYIQEDSDDNNENDDLSLSSRKSWNELFLDEDS